jgi:hypothetical protein
MKVIVVAALTAAGFSAIVAISTRRCFRPIPRASGGGRRRAGVRRRQRELQTVPCARGSNGMDVCRRISAAETLVRRLSSFRTGNEPRHAGLHHSIEPYVRRDSVADFSQGIFGKR